MQEVKEILKAILDLVNTLPIMWRVFFTFLIIILLAAVGVTPAILSRGDCGQMQLQYKNEIDSLILTQNFKDQTCQITIQEFIKSQEKLQSLYASLLGVEKTISALQPDTILVKPPLPPVTAGSPDSGLHLKKKIPKNCPVCPVEKVQPNKIKAVLTKKIDEMKKILKE